jgi:hypothetical protein
MKRAGAAILTALLALSCDEGDKGGTACANADYSECGSPLPAQQANGQPWPTYDEALTAALQCSSRSGSVVFRGECADGKQFITNAGIFAGGTYFYVNGSLVGISSYTDAGGEPCQCPFSSFQGTLEAVRCARPTFEPLCGTSPSQVFEPAFASNTDCQCDALPSSY